MKGSVTPPGRGAAVTGAYVDLDGRRFYRITDYDRIPPFLMTLASSSDVWLFASSTGGLTAGRVDADRALFPYYTDDKVTESAGRTGGLSLVRVASPDGATTCWEPFSGAAHGDGVVARNLYKDILGTTLVFEETRVDLGLRLRVSWQASDRFGVVRTCQLTSLSQRSCTVELLDGLVNVLPAGVGVTVQNELSNLLDAYKRCEVDRATGLAMAWLSSTLTDLAEPSESLRASVAWQVGLGEIDYLLSVRQLAPFRRGDVVSPEWDVRGERCAYLGHTRFTLGPSERRRWHVVGDVDRDAADAVDLRARLRRPEELMDDVEADLVRTRTSLESLLAAADADQRGGDELATSHHLANVLYNAMRGGVPIDGYRIQAEDFRAFVAQRNRSVARGCEAVLEALPERLLVGDLVAGASAHGDDDLWRLAMEYLPLTFSRRHGDPSRPWNRFRIAVRDARGRPRLDYQGNWRDIFQNWEALAWSFPEYVESMVTVFLNATTADGYNPYRISRDGVDWEVPEPDNPWSNIGYWSDHQIIYLLRLLETSQRFHPGRLARLINRAVFTHADVPYRIKPYSSLIENPFATIEFDAARDALARARTGELGSDGRLLHHDGELFKITLAEKLLLLLLAKLINLVPEGGIWMNTQRPEWNDANNALVGRGVSVVTLAYLRRYLIFLRTLLSIDVEVTLELGDLFGAIHATLAEHAEGLDQGFDDARRRAVMDCLGEAGSAYRSRVYQGFDGRRVLLPAPQVVALLDLAQRFVEAGLRANRRQDALYHSYNLLDLTEAGAGIRRLPEMLEGQVAVLSSGLLDASESLALLQRLRTGPLYREDQHSYLLYPDKDLPGFLSRNRFDASQAVSCPLVDQLAHHGDRTVVVRDMEGVYHFARSIHNARDVEAALDRLSTDPRWHEAVERDRPELLAIFEGVFRHAEFTGRSGSFFAYEGLGSIYWHMVAKLLLAVQETLDRATADDASGSTIDALIRVYQDVQAGLGYRKSPGVYGAFPTDPYSHTPAGGGARQPGMTGQVKEEVLLRLRELGLGVEDGCIIVRPTALFGDEWTVDASPFSYRDVNQHVRSIDLPAGSFAFTFGQVPVVYRRAERFGMIAHLADGSAVTCPQGRLDAELSASVFRRQGVVTVLTADIPARSRDRGRPR